MSNSIKPPTAYTTKMYGEPGRYDILTALSAYITASLHISLSSAGFPYFKASSMFRSSWIKQILATSAMGILNRISYKHVEQKGFTVLKMNKLIQANLSPHQLIYYIILIYWGFCNN